MTPHDTRHTYASWLIQDGVTIEQLSKLLGHKAISTTQRYANPRELHQTGEKLQVAC
ncbi:MAG: tyrosine-type recombinase/integrase [Haloechinothrix sp.]